MKTKLEYVAASIFQRSDNCWIWTGYVDPDGYGTACFAGKKEIAHRFVYEMIRCVETPKSVAVTFDHLCRNRACVNPDHLELVSRGENVLRGESIPATNARRTECVHGHLFDEVNTRVSIDKNGYTHRACKRCMKIRLRQWKRTGSTRGAFGN